MVGPVIIPKRTRNKANLSPELKKRRGLIVIFFIFILAVFYFLFQMNSSDTPRYLEGAWNRSDGDYTIEIKNVLDDGKLNTAYFNPNPIHVGKAEWNEKDGKIQVFIELRDKNYPGSIYRLTYVKETETLAGTYYQAVAKQTYEVYFTKDK